MVLLKKYRTFAFEVPWPNDNMHPRNVQERFHTHVRYSFVKLSLGDDPPPFDSVNRLELSRVATIIQAAWRGWHRRKWIWIDNAIDSPRDTPEQRNYWLRFVGGHKRVLKIAERYRRRRLDHVYNSPWEFKRHHFTKRQRKEFRKQAQRVRRLHTLRRRPTTRPRAIVQRDSVYYL